MSGLIAALRRVRLERGLSRNEVAEACGFYQNNLERWERGEHVPSVLNWEAVINALGYEVKLEPKAGWDGLRGIDAVQRRRLEIAARGR